MIMGNKAEIVRHEYRNSKQIQNSKVQNSKQAAPIGYRCSFCFGHLDFDHLNLFRISDFVLRIYSYLSSILSCPIFMRIGEKVSSRGNSFLFPGWHRNCFLLL